MEDKPPGLTLQPTPLRNWASWLTHPTISLRPEPGARVTREPSVKSRFQFQPLRSSAHRLGLGLLLGIAAAHGTRADEIDDYVAAQMSRQHIPGLSLAVLK